MPRKLSCLLIGLSLIAIPVLAQGFADRRFDEEKASSELAWISDIEGIVRLNSEPVTIKALISERDELSTQDGRVEAYLNGSYVRLNQHSKIVFAALQEESILVDIRYGEVYIQAENMIKVQTPHEAFSLDGLYRIEVDRYETKKFRNPVLEDDFDKWSYEREKGIDRQGYLDEEAEYEPSYWGSYPYGGWAGWYPLYPYWISYPYWYWADWYYGWHSYWYWTSWYLGWHPYWHWTNWYYYSYYPYYYSYYSHFSHYRTVIHKGQLKKRVPQNIGVRQLRRSTKGVSATTAGKRLGQSSKAKLPRAFRSRVDSARKLSRAIGKTYPSRISYKGKTTVKRSNYSRLSSRLRATQRYLPLSRSIQRRSYSKYSRYYTNSRSRSSRTSSRSFSPRSISRSSTSRSFSSPSSRSISRSSSSVRSTKVRKR